MTGDALARELAERASESLEPIYVRLDRIAEEVLRARPPRAAFTEAHLSNLQRLLVVFIGEERAAWGMGFIAAPSCSSSSRSAWCSFHVASSRRSTYLVKNSCRNASWYLQ